LEHPYIQYTYTGPNNATKTFGKKRILGRQGGGGGAERRCWVGTEPRI